MPSLPFYIVDVFAESKYAGNQLAVVLNAGGLTDAAMQAIAKEMNYSETTFVISPEPKDGGYEVRIFTPGEEVPFAGHPTLGTAFIIKQEIGKENLNFPDLIKLNLKVGQIPVTFIPPKNGEPELLWMNQKPLVFGKVLTPQALAQVLNISPERIDSRFPIQEVSTGLPFIIVPLKDLATVKNCRVDQKLLLELVKDLEAKAILVFAPETYDPKNHLNVRVFVDCYSIPEDPATGSANGCLAGYLVKHEYFGNNQIDLRVEQGMEIGRPSLLYLKAKKELNQIEISVGGRVILVAKGGLV